jgi:hypothetical protein
LKRKFFLLEIYVHREQGLARTKATLGAGARLSDHLSASLLARVYPVGLAKSLSPSPERTERLDLRKS